MSRSTFALVALSVLCVSLAVAPPAYGTSGPRAGALASSTTHDKVNINSASVKELMTLEGVGHKLAEKIVEYREAHGPFKKAEELRKVEGVGGVLWEKNRERIVVK